jgi:hypothetical protein
MSVTLSTLDWLQIIGLGGLLGAVGQGARTVVGLKKLHDEASEANASVGDMISASRLLVSLALGFIAGALAAITIVDNAIGANGPRLSGQQIAGLIAAGYAGADFIEGFMARQRSGGSGTAVAVAATDEAVG